MTTTGYEAILPVMPIFRGSGWQFSLPIDLIPENKRDRLTGANWAEITAISSILDILILF
ncbi:hypothetical protein GC197_01830 [bacterium]|nr:hypothetical protein [bacterium]